MKVKIKHIIIILLFLAYVPHSSERVLGYQVNFPDELFKPVNQRLANNLSHFEYSNYIDRQVTRFMERSALKGVSLAVVKNEELVFAQSYGYADIENNIETAPEHLFRIASVSKLLTAVAVMKLVEDGKMSLEDQVFGEDGYFDDPEYLKLKDRKLLDIKVVNLLDHTAGWTQRFGDPMFHPVSIAQKMNQNPPATVDTYLKFAVSRRLYYKPGTAYGYSNMAYVFLGAIIEKVSGMKYEDYVRFQILYPNNIYDMHLGRNSFDEKFPNEVRYYEQEGSIKVKACNGDTSLVSKSYGGNDIELLSAAGGWIASAPELAKFMTLIDGFDDVPDILSKESIQIMTEGLGSGNPLGWRDTYGSYWTRTGSFAGTAAVIHRKPDGTQWVFISNTSNWQGPKFSDDIKRLMRRIDSRVKSWPNQDLFNYYNPEELSYYPLMDQRGMIN